MTFEPGKSGNPNGYKGPRDRARRQVFEMIEGLGLIDSLQILCTIANDVNTDPSIRVAAAAASVNHFHPKLQSVPTPRFIEESIQLPFPEPKTLEQANANIAYLSAHKAQGLISIDSADSLIGDNQSVVNNLIVEEELKFKLYPPEHQ